MFKIGDKVSWKWRYGKVDGEVVDVFPTRMTIEIKGKLITRNGSSEDPAVLVRSVAGNLALKLHHELSVLF